MQINKIQYTNCSCTSRHVDIEVSIRKHIKIYIKLKSVWQDWRLSNLFIWSESSLAPEKPLQDESFGVCEVHFGTTSKVSMLVIQLKTHMHAKISLQEYVSSILFLVDCCTVNGIFCWANKPERQEWRLRTFALCYVLFMFLKDLHTSQKLIAFSGLTVNFTSPWTVRMKEFNVWCGNNTVRRLHGHTNRGNKPVIWIQTEPVIRD